MGYNELSTLYPNPGLSSEEKKNLNDRRDSYRVGLLKYPIQVESTGDQYLQITLSTIPISTQVMISGKIMHQKGFLKFTLIGDVLTPSEITTNYDETQWGRSKIFLSGVTDEVWECRAYYTPDLKMYFEIKGFQTTLTDFGLLTIDEIIYVDYPIKTDDFPVNEISVATSATPMGGNSATCIVNQQEQSKPKNVMSSDTVGFGKGQYIQPYSFERGTPTTGTYYLCFPLGYSFSGELVISFNSNLVVLDINNSGANPVISKRYYNATNDYLPEDGLVTLSPTGDPDGGVWLGITLASNDYQSTDIVFRGFVDNALESKPYLLENMFTVYEASQVTIQATEYRQYVELAARSDAPFISTISNIAGFSKKSQVDI